MLEIVITFLGLAFLWAFLYSKTSTTTPYAVLFRILYLGLTLSTVYELLSFLIIYAQNSNLPQNVADLIIGYMSVMNIVIFLILALVIVFTLINSVLPIFRKKEKI